MLEEVPKADVILVNPTHVAVAIRYDSAVSDAPVVKAKGGDHMCEKIKEIARAYGVPIVRKPKLARAIFKTVKIDEAIPDPLTRCFLHPLLLRGAPESSDRFVTRRWSAVECWWSAPSMRVRVFMRV